MSYRIVLSDIAEVEINAAYLWMLTQVSLEQTKHWYAGLLDAIES